MDVLMQELRLVRRNGYAMDREEYQPGVICMGAPIRDHTGAVVGSISASAPLMRASDPHLEVIKQEIIAATQSLSRELGEDLSPAAARNGAAMAQQKPKLTSKRRGEN
jgi:IclR family transcriptional regulator, acetate operon repressor